MLELTVRGTSENVVVQFEHSLLSLSKWESKHKKPLLGRIPPTALEMLDYYSCMLLTPGVDPDVVYSLEPAQMEELGDYMNDPRTASSVPSQGDGKGRSAETLTSELIYYWMVEMKIDWSAEGWHLNRLMMLIQITNFKRNPNKHKNTASLEARWAEANERQKAMFGTDG